jgi:hypothetical protein
MQKNHPIGQRFMTYVLLISLFLQSCYKPYNHTTPRPVEVEQETKRIQLDPSQGEPGSRVGELALSEETSKLLTSSTAPTRSGQGQEEETSSVFSPLVKVAIFA